MTVHLDWDVETDVLVIGAGGCGLVAAVAAHDAGAEVIIVEKERRPGGNTTLSTGSVPGAGTRFQREAGIDDSPERMIEDLMRQSGPHDVPELTRLLAYESASLVEWLVDEVEVDLRLITDYRHVGHSVPRLHAPPSREGEDLVRDLVAAVNRRGIPLAVANPVTELVTSDDGAVLGARVVTEGGEASLIRARKVILAVNGFGGNRELLRKYCPEIADAPYFGHKGNTGEAIVWGEQLGAGFGNMGAYQGYAAVSYPYGTLLSWTTMEMGGVLVDRRGRRMGNETAGYSGFAKDVIRHGNLAYAIYDRKVHEYVAAHEELYRELVASGGVKEAATLEELAAIYGLDAAALRETVEAYNAAARGEREDEFGRRDFGLGPLEPPWKVCQVTAGLFHTQGGLLVDERARVLRRDGRAIPNLFAGGGAAAGISGRAGSHGYASGNGLLTALGLGRIAGRAAAEEIQREG
ncbi:MAG TPA: FAD-dependent oxidoreductase [Limnochordales bacterium]